VLSLPFPPGLAFPAETREAGGGSIAIAPPYTRTTQVPGDDHRLPAGKRTVRHVQPLDQPRDLNHRHHQFVAVEQHADLVGKAMLADGVEVLWQFVPALVDAVAAGLGVRLAFGRGTSDGGFQRGQQVLIGGARSRLILAAVDQQATRVPQEGGHPQVGAAVGLDHAAHHDAATPSKRARHTVAALNLALSLLPQLPKRVLLRQRLRVRGRLRQSARHAGDPAVVHVSQDTQDERACRALQSNPQESFVDDHEDLIFTDLDAFSTTPSAPTTPSASDPRYASSSNTNPSAKGGGLIHVVAQAVRRHEKLTPWRH
jgi:hypothetical protein